MLFRSGALGVSENMTAVVYDGAGLFSAARVWWMLRHFGMREVYVLDGGLPAWKAAGGKLDAGPVTRPAATFKATHAPERVAHMADVAAALKAGGLVLDARAGARFRGEVPEPRPGLPSGHMPGATSLPMTDLTADGRLLAPEA